MREIKGDPLKDMPQLSTHPSEYKPTGRYTEERKEIIEKVHKEEFLLARRAQAHARVYECPE